jgi:hypothetical protein
VEWYEGEWSDLERELEEAEEWSDQDWSKKERAAYWACERMWALTRKRGT